MLKDIGRAKMKPLLSSDRDAARASDNTRLTWSASRPQPPATALAAAAPAHAADPAATGLAPARPLRVAILYPHRLFRECLAAALREEALFSRVEVADVNRAALARLAGGGPVEVLVLGCAETSELRELLPQAREHWPDAKVLVLGAEEGQTQALALLCEGVQGYLFGDQSLAELREAILEVAAGATICTPRVAHLLFSRLSELGRDRRRDEQLEALELTARELEILRLIADGLKNQDIAQRLYLSVHTVKNHVHNIIKRLGVKSRWSAVNHACDKGWLQPRRRFPSA
jgi:DNA-binding NarL/FixJ family response regulator